MEIGGKKAGKSPQYCVGLCCFDDYNKYSKDGDLLIETTATSFGVFVVVVETA